MTMQKNRQLIALPNVLREQTAPNTLRGMRQDPAPTSRQILSIPTIALVVGAAVALALILFGRQS